MSTVVHGDFEWDDEKAASNLAKHGVTFQEAALSMKDPLSLDFEDVVEPVANRAYPLSRLNRSRRPPPHHQRARRDII